MQTAAANINLYCIYMTMVCVKYNSASREGVIELEDKSTEPMKAFIMLSSWPSSQDDCDIRRNSRLSSSDCVNSQLSE